MAARSQRLKVYLQQPTKNHFHENNIKKHNNDDGGR